MHRRHGPLDASRRLWALAGLAAFVAVVVAVVGPFEVGFEFLDGGDIDAGIGQGMAVLAASATVIWLLMALMVRTGLARAKSLPWPLPGFLAVTAPPSPEHNSVQEHAQSQMDEDQLQELEKAEQEIA